ncbi:MAG: ECF-type sigma factor [Isosphaerales bacterium]
MRNETSSEEDAALIRRFAAGEANLIGELQGRLARVMAGMAKRLFRRHRVSTSVYGEDDAINDAESELCEDARAGKLGSVRTADHLLKIIHSALKRRILVRRRHDAAIRHGGPGVSRPGREDQEDATTGGRPASGRGFHQCEGALDDLDTGEPSPVDLSVAKDDREALVFLLNDPMLETILTLLMKGDTYPEIARKLGVSVFAVDRRVKRIRSASDKINSKHA